MYKDAKIGFGSFMQNIITYHYFFLLNLGYNVTWTCFHEIQSFADDIFHDVGFPRRATCPHLRRMPGSGVSIDYYFVFAEVSLAFCWGQKNDAVVTLKTLDV